MADGASVFKGPAARIRGSSKAPSLGGASDILQGLSYPSIPGAGGTDSALWLELTTERGRSEPGRTGVKTFVFQVQNQGSADQDVLGHCGVRLPLPLWGSVTIAVIPSPHFHGLRSTGLWKPSLPDSSHHTPAPGRKEGPGSWRWRSWPAALRSAEPDGACGRGVSSAAPHGLVLGAGRDRPQLPTRGLAARRLPPPPRLCPQRFVSGASAEGASLAPARTSL